VPSSVQGYFFINDVDAMFETKETETEHKTRAFHGSEPSFLVSVDTVQSGMWITTSCSDVLLRS
jgi:hypothetical protein